MSEWVYGFHAVESVLKREPKRILELWLLEGRRDKRAQGLITLAANQGVSLARVGRTVMDDAISGRHQGVAAKVTPGERSLEFDDKALLEYLDEQTCPFVLVLDGVTDPHNFGACLRSADAAGVHAVIVPKNNSADLTPVVRKVACGAAETVPVARVTNLARTLEALKQLGIWTVGTSGAADTSLFEQDLRGPTALILGAEGEGMRRLTTEACDYLVKLPMAGSVESLNVSVATGICLFEVVRQRQ